jgi:hypothetical protein
MNKGLRTKFGKYLFEVSVIFIGMTLSFLFEEWRTNREKHQIASTHLKEIKSEALTVKHIVSIYDSIVRAEILRMDNLIERKELTNNEAFELLSLSTSNRDFSLTYKLQELQTLKATGEVSLINPDIVTMLALIQVAADKIEGVRYEASLFDQLMRLVISNTKFVSDRSSNVISMDYSKFIKSTQGVKELIVWRGREKRTPLYNLQLLNERCDELIKMVNNEAEKN